MLIKKRYLYDLIWPLHLTYKHYSRSLHTLWSKTPCGWSTSQTGAKGEKMWSKEGFFIISAMTLSFNLEKWFKVTTHPLLKSIMYEANRAKWKVYTCMLWTNDFCKVWYDLDPWPKNFIQDITAHSLPRSTLWVRFEPDWVKGIEDILLTSDLGWTDGRTDWSPWGTRRAGP